MAIQVEASLYYKGYCDVWKVEAYCYMKNVKNVNKIMHNILVQNSLCNLILITYLKFPFKFHELEKCTLLRKSGTYEPLKSAKIMHNYVWSRHLFLVWCPHCNQGSCNLWNQLAEYFLRKSWKCDLTEEWAERRNSSYIIQYTSVNLNAA